eukprot:CAMPEP_0117083644 /NCGR_PEP_ID=MMETSP0472-20121206/58886_1 /TAXON_ID=693140 ORGANISM="Tiarina fusus, Strain LIS" /NCGR_SAMPLE_ID=MMETSP0472 /ASSEMBLY_ACC=CAM_ASM_000603 /LENGTH=38 /DNA_ID= /DNA_START= /DNA_END= /DNA_ORIENTATION=
MSPRATPGQTDQTAAVGVGTTLFSQTSQELSAGCQGCR